MILSRSEQFFWRMIGLIALSVSALNLVILLHGQHSNQPIPNLPTNFNTKEKGSRTDCTAEPISETRIKTATHKEQSKNRKEEIDAIRRTSTNDKQSFKIDIPKSLKNPVWLPVVKIDKYFERNQILSLGVPRTSQGFVVFGIPTVYRKKAYYLLKTVQWLVTNLSEEEKQEVVIVVFVADDNEEYRQKIVKDIQTNFPEDDNKGLIHVIRAPKDYYPDFKNLPLLYGDKPERVIWRSKQSLDYSFLYFYCANLAKYYIQLEDDVLTEPGYLKKIKTFIESKDDDWSILEFGARGFIGMTYRTKHLLSLARFCRLYFWTMPVDWLFRMYNDVFLNGNKKTNVLSPPVFKHIGEYSSLDGQVRKLEDIRSGNKESFPRLYQSPKGNPEANIQTSINNIVVPHTIQSAYNAADGFFWGKTIKENDFIEIVFIKIETVSEIVISSGSPKHPADTFGDTELYISSTKTCDNYKKVNEFQDIVLIKHTVEGVDRQIYCIKLVLTSVRVDHHGRNNWLIVKEIAIV